MGLEQTITCDLCGESITGYSQTVRLPGAAGIGSPTGYGGWALYFHPEDCLEAFCEGLVSLLDSGEAASTARERQSTRHADRDAARERWRMQEEWRRSETFTELLATFDGVPISRQMAHTLADAGYDLERCRQASDTELLHARGGSGKYIGQVTLVKLRTFFAGEKSTPTPSDG